MKRDTTLLSLDIYSGDFGDTITHSLHTVIVYIMMSSSDDVPDGDPVAAATDLG